MASGYLILISGFLISVLTTVLLTPAVCKLALRYGWVDAPDGRRKLHRRPTPTIGGLAIAAGFVVGAIYFSLLEDSIPFDLPLPPFPVWVGALVIVGAGFYDDTRGLSFKQKFLIQVVAAYLLLHAGFRIDVSGFAFLGSSEYQQALWSIPLTLLWVVGVINAVNLLDGLDGLAAGVSMIAFAFLSLTFVLQGDVGPIMLVLPILGALVGFLTYNSNPAVLFMGDSGSLFLGYSLATFSLMVQPLADPKVAPLVLVLSLGVPVLDTSLAMVRRFASRKTIFAPDHDHIHHRLSRLLSHRKAVLVLYIAAACFGSVAVLMTLVSAPVSVLLLVLSVVAVYFALAKLGYVPTPRARSIDDSYPVLKVSSATTATEHPGPVQHQESNVVELAA